MGILLAFAPFIAFAVADHFAGSTPALWIGALTSAALLVVRNLEIRRIINIDSITLTIQARVTSCSQMP